MVAITQEEYEEYLRRNGHINVEDVDIPLQGRRKLSTFGPAPDFKLEASTVWSFPERGNWATHDGRYRGNWSPRVPRNLILKYSLPGDTVLDQMCGGGTTLVEAKILGRRAIGVDSSQDALMLTMDRLNFRFESPIVAGRDLTTKVFRGDARDLDALGDASIDFIATHPPYWRIVAYSKADNPLDLSRIPSFEGYVAAVKKVASEAYRVLKPGKICAILVGNTRERGHCVPISHRVMRAFLEVGFILVDDIVKMQWNVRSASLEWKLENFQSRGFHAIYHENLFVFRKLAPNENIADYANSANW